QKSKYTNTGIFYISTGDRKTVIIPNLAAWSLRPADPLSGVEDSTWSRVTRVPLRIPCDELERVVRKQAKKISSLWKLLSSLLTYQKQQIDRLIQDTEVEDPDLTHYEWVLAALKFDPEKGVPAFALSIQVVLQRQRRVNVSILAAPPVIAIPNMLPLPTPIDLPPPAHGVAQRPHPPRPLIIDVPPPLPPQPANS